MFRNPGGIPVPGSSSLNLKNLVLGGVIVMSGAHSAKAITVSRCNALVEGVYQPVLVVQPTKGEKTVYHIGDEGLTRQIIFNEAAALAWVKQRFAETQGRAVFSGSRAFRVTRIALIAAMTRPTVSRTARMMAAAMTVARNDATASARYRA